MNENIKDLLDVIYLEDKMVIQEKLDHMLLFGHTSGIDTLFGILIGLRAMVAKEKNN